MAGIISMNYYKNEGESAKCVNCLRTNLQETIFEVYCLTTRLERGIRLKNLFIRVFSHPFELNYDLREAIT